MNAERAKAKVPLLLCDGPTTDKHERARQKRIKNGLKRLREHDPVRYRGLETRLIWDLEAFEKAALEKSGPDKKRGGEVALDE